MTNRRFLLYNESAEYTANSRESEQTLMKTTGITRPIDALGRIVIPMEIRESFGIKPKDNLEIFVNGDQIVLKKPVDS